MLAHVEGSRRPRQTLDYNERKLTQGKAVFIAAFNYWEDKDQLDGSQKLERLHELALRNERTQKSTAHMSLNFHPADNLTDKQLAIISAQYLKAIEFGDQPALVYRHLDAGHPHCHIVSSNIRPDGTRISNDLRSPHHLEEVCRKLEQYYHLTPVRGENIEHQHLRQQETSRALRLHYGESATRTGIEKVLNHVLEEYAYTSVDRLNALLSLYNVMADTGSPQSHLYQNRGLYYRMLDDEGKRIGAPIKASAFDSHPTLDYLERRFAENQLLVQNEKHQQRVRLYLDWTIMKEPPTLDKLTTSLQREGIQLVIDPSLRRQTYAADGHAFYYINFESKTIYRDTDLGEKYTASSIFQRMHLDQQLYELVQQQHLHLTHKKDAAILEDPDPAKKLNLWVLLAQQHNDWTRTMEQEQTLRHRQHHRLRL